MQSTGKLLNLPGPNEGGTPVYPLCSSGDIGALLHHGVGPRLLFYMCFHAVLRANHRAGQVTGWQAHGASNDSGGLGNTRL